LNLAQLGREKQVTENPNIRPDYALPENSGNFYV
jgi:hypothetical protein